MTSSRTSSLALVALVAAAVACGGPQQPRGEGDGAIANRSPVDDARTPIEKRRDTACEQLGPKLTACAVDDARADLAAGRVAQAQFDRDTAPEVQRKNTEEFVTACKGASYSSRQVRVLEVCFREETRCAALLDCLGHLNDTGANR